MPGLWFDERNVAFWGKICSLSSVIFDKEVVNLRRLLLRTLAMPSDTNANGDIFGGWIMSQMDMGGATLAKEIALVAVWSPLP